MIEVEIEGEFYFYFLLIPRVCSLVLLCIKCLSKAQHVYTLVCEIVFITSLAKHWICAFDEENVKCMEVIHAWIFIKEHPWKGEVAVPKSYNTNTLKEKSVCPSDKWYMFDAF